MNFSDAPWSIFTDETSLRYLGVYFWKEARRSSEGCLTVSEARAGKSITHASFGTRDCDIEQSAFFLDLCERVYAHGRREKVFFHADYVYVFEFKPFRGVLS